MQVPELWTVTQNSVSSTHNCVNELPVYGLPIPEIIGCSFLSFPTTQNPRTLETLFYCHSITKTFPLLPHVKCCQKPHLEHLFCCHNTQCHKPGGFTGERGLHSHYGMSLWCAAHAAAFQAYLRGNIIAQPSPFLSEPWDIDDEDTIKLNWWLGY